MISGPFMALASVLLIASSEGGADAVKIDEARSLIAEAAQIERQAAAGRLTGAYAKALRGDIRKGLVDLEQTSLLKSVIEDALAAMDRRDAARLSAIAEQLAARERSLGRAG